jgi:epoxide hydrolase-like predicted phosphatase
MIKLIIFDVGGVIDRFDESQYIDYISKKLGIDAVEFRNALIPPLDSMEIGKSTLLDMKKKLSRKFNVSQRALEWDEAFEKLESVNKQVVNLMSRLSKHYRVAILTNVSRSRHMVKVERYLGNIKAERTFASCYLKMAKPDPRIYRFVLNEMKIRPEEAIFIDNLKRNVVGAEKVGIKSIQFTDYNLLASKLKKLGVNTE